MRAGIRIASAAVLGAAALACAGNAVRFEQLPEAPIALIHRTDAEARDRAEALRKQRGEVDAPRTALGAPVLDLGAVDDYVDRVRGDPGRSAPSGRVALLRPRARTVEPLDPILPGAVPMEWSRDHRRLLYVSRRRGTPELFELVLDGPEIRQLTRGGPARLAGTYGPDGRLAWVQVERTEGTLHLSIWATEPGGIEPRRITDGPRDRAVRWSPDGRWLYWESTLPSGGPGLMALDLEADPAVPMRVARGADASFDPTGEWVVYSRRIRGDWRLWRMRPDGSGKAALGETFEGNPVQERYPAVSPDGRYVAYVAEQDDRQRIHVRRMDGTGDTLLLEDGDGALPVW